MLGAEAPYSGCLQHLEVLHWQGDVVRVDDVSLTWVPKPLSLPSVYMYLYPLIVLIKNSTLMQKLLDENQNQLNQHRAQTHIVANKLIEASHLTVTNTNHHWYDFLFKPVSASKYWNAIFHPILICITIIVLLYVCNIFIYCRIRKMYLTLTPKMLTSCAINMSNSRAQLKGYRDLENPPCLCLCCDLHWKSKIWCCLPGRTGPSPEEISTFDL